MEVNHGADTFNETVLYEIRRILSIIKQKPEAALPEKEKENHGDVYEVAYRQAEKDFFEAHKQMNALEDQAMKFLTGENTVDISIVNAMMPKYKEKLETAQRRMEEAKAKMEKEKDAARICGLASLGQLHNSRTGALERRPRSFVQPASDSFSPDGEQPTGLTLISAPHRCERCALPRW